MSDDIFNCSICSENYSSFNFLSFYYKVYYEYLPDCKILCGIHNCQKYYKNVRCLKRYVSSKHNIFQSIAKKKEMEYFFSLNNENIVYDETERFDTDPESYMESLDFKDEIFHFLLSLKKKYIKCHGKAVNMLFLPFKTLLIKLKRKSLKT